MGTVRVGILSLIGITNLLLACTPFHVKNQTPGVTRA